MQQSPIAAKLLIAAGDNSDRIRSEAGFAALCGVSPVRASLGKTTRHRLNRSGDRQANNALWVIAMVRLSHYPATRAYSKPRKTEGLSHREMLLKDLAKLTEEYQPRPDHADRGRRSEPVGPSGHRTASAGRSRSPPQTSPLHRLTEPMTTVIDRPNPHGV